MSGGYVRPAEPSDIQWVTAHLRQADVEEWEAFLGVHPRTLLPFMANDPNTYAILNGDGVPVGLCGVGPIKDNPLIGLVWMVATPQLEAHSLEFLRKCRAVIEMFHETYPILWNHVDERNRVHLKWLRWCGFKFIARKERYGAKSLPFLEIVRIKKPCA